MTTAIARDPIYRRRRFDSEIIELCVRWYLTYRLSYRDLVEMMAERGVTVSHSTILRWVQRYVPEFERRWDRFARPVHSSWRMDETAVSVRGGPGRACVPEVSAKEQALFGVELEHREIVCIRVSLRCALVGPIAS